VSSDAYPYDVTIVVPVRNAGRHLRRCLESLERAAVAELRTEILVVDNGSTDDSARIALERGCRVIDAPGLRVGAVRNRGARAAGGRLLAFVDADNEVAPGWLSCCRSALDEPGVGAAGLAYRAPHDGTWVQQFYDLLRSRPAARRRTDWLSAGNLGVRRDVFDRLGGFDEALEACEDVDLCSRIRRCGLDVMSEPGMSSVHHGDPSTLRALFVGELWRGRDNLKVSLRGPLSLRALPGTLGPIVVLILLTLLPFAAAASLVTGPLPFVAVAGSLAAMIGARALVMIRRGRLPLSGAWGRSLAVAATFEVARALALVGRATHGTRARPQGA
jgi:hypothetical protein